MKCPQCGRDYGTRIRVKTQEIVCNKCGYIGKLPQEEKKSIDKTDSRD